MLRQAVADVTEEAGRIQWSKVGLSIHVHPACSCINHSHHPPLLAHRACCVVQKVAGMDVARGLVVCSG